MNRVVTVGVVDSGFSRDQAQTVDCAAAFVVDSEMLVQREAQYDCVQHGTAVIRAIATTAPAARLAVAQVFTERFTTTPSQVAAAIHWLLDQRVDLINLSLGLRADRPVLQAACAAAAAAGIPLCAATPARGDPVFPAAYPGVLRMTGDARCAETEWSCLETRYADFGAFVRSSDGRVAGASIGTGYLSGHISAYLATGGAADVDSIRRYLRENACYFGAERRTG
ncbi:subtilisin-like serine protease QhpE [Sedimenticola sp.]|uniref:subtilisin-like serine protease QhpE n=1 Tax=Sedimenticola sp. TaxID=1940285 RepID=UPI00258E56A8|nr:S8 family serine peptidase [Sedimenticola sp.]MCW8903461.1 S8 family serine peptidase [Sedimenticola sp.]